MQEAAIEHFLGVVILRGWNHSSRGGLAPVKFHRRVHWSEVSSSVWCVSGVLKCHSKTVKDAMTRMDEVSPAPHSHMYCTH
jgi:hypothetical protein